MRAMSEDPRVLRAIKSLKEPRRVYAVVSSKGGVGKTTVSTLLSLYSAKMGYSTGLLDLDFVNPSTHIALGLKPSEIRYVEHRGLLPLKLNNLHYFTIAAFTEDRPMALRGHAVYNALWEVLSIVNWGGIHVLFIDTPPGVGDEHLELVYKLRGVLKPLVVSTPSRLSTASAKKLIHILRKCGYREVYLVENMGTGELEDYAEELGAVYLGYIPYTSELEHALGNPEKLVEVRVGEHVKSILSKLL